MKYLSLTVLIVMSTLAFTTNAGASLSKLGQPLTQQCKAASKACAQKRADCEIIVRDTFF